MKKQFVIFLRAIGIILSVIIMIFIFGFSSKTAENSANESSKVTEFILKIFTGNFKDYTVEQQEELIIKWHPFIRKLAHFSEYCLLDFCLCLSLFNVSFKKKYLSGIIINIFCLLYATTDEVHQLFVEGRGCSIKDILIDFSGALVGFVVYSLIYRIIKHSVNKKNNTI